VTGTPTLNAHDLSQLSSGASAPAESTPVALINYAVGAAAGTPAAGSSLSGDGKRGYLTGQIAFSGIVTGGTVVAQLSTAAHYPATVRVFGVPAGRRRHADHSADRRGGPDHARLRYRRGRHGEPRRPVLADHSLTVSSCGVRCPSAHRFTSAATSAGSGG
jgi:hypothetical protein